MSVKKMHIESLFPIPVGVFNFEKKLKKSELDFINNIERRRNLGNAISMNSKVLESPKLKRLKNFIDESIDVYFQYVYRPRSKINLYITQSWINYTNKNEWHHKHSHQNSFLSGVFYLKTNLDLDTIQFFRENVSPFQIYTENFHQFNSNSWSLNAIESHLYIFPSTLTHMVKNKEHDGERISLSFNTFLVGTLGDDQERNELTLSK